MVNNTKFFININDRNKIKIDKQSNNNLVYY